MFGEERKDIRSASGEHTSMGAARNFDLLRPTELLTKCRDRGLRAEEHMSVATVLKASETVAPEFEQIFREHCQLVYRTAYTADEVV